MDSSSLRFYSVIEHLTKTKLVIDSVAFSEWRKAGASKSTGAVAASSQPSAAPPSPAQHTAPNEEGPRKSPRPTLAESVSKVRAASAAEGPGSGSDSGSSPEDDEPMAADDDDSDASSA